MTTRFSVIFMSIAILLMISSCGGGGSQQNSAQKETTEIQPPETTDDTIPQPTTDDTIPQPTTDTPRSSGIAESLCPQENWFYNVTPDKEVSELSGDTLNNVTIGFKQNSSNNLNILIKIKSENLFSYGFYLAYNPSTYEFIGYEPTEALYSEGVTAKIIGTSKNAGIREFSGCTANVLVVSHSRIGYDTPGVPLNSTTTVGILNFKVLKKHTTEFIFAGTSLSTRVAPKTAISFKDLPWPKKFQLTL